VKVMTGSRIPPGADAVVRWEDTDLGDVEVEIRMPVASQQNIRAVDDEVACGQLIAPARSYLNPPRLAALVAAGITSLSVVPRPRVGILTTGDELVGEGEPVHGGQVVDSNRPLVKAFVQLAGGCVSDVSSVGDDKDLTRRTMGEMAARCDVLVTTGGVSVGERDWVRAAIEEAGVVEFWRVAMHPGKPLLFGHLDGTPVLCLPGNPTSVVACCYVFLGPLLEATAGATQRRPPLMIASSEQVAGRPESVQLIGGWIENGRLRPLRVRHPGLGQLAATDGLAIIDNGGVEVGDEVPFIPFL
jgi:molybdopterin molybdotransferase